MSVQRYRHGWIKIGTTVDTPGGKGVVKGRDDTHSQVKLHNGVTQRFEHGELKPGDSEAKRAHLKANARSSSIGRYLDTGRKQTSAGNGVTTKGGKPVSY